LEERRRIMAVCPNVTECWWGVGTSVVDISSQMNAALQAEFAATEDDHPSMIIGDFSFTVTDPAPGHVKFLFMTYTSGGDTNSHNYNGYEGAIFTF